MEVYKLKNWLIPQQDDVKDMIIKLNQKMFSAAVGFLDNDYKVGMSFVIKAIKSAMYIVASSQINETEEKKQSEITELLKWLDETSDSLLKEFPQDTTKKLTQLFGTSAEFGKSYTAMENITIMIAIAKNEGCKFDFS